jgi:hypothetical protein
MEKPKCLCGAIKGSRHAVSCPYAYYGSGQGRVSSWHDERARKVEKLKSDRRKKAEKRLGKRLWV